MRLDNKKAILDQLYELRERFRSSKKGDLRKSGKYGFVDRSEGIKIAESSLNFFVENADDASILSTRRDHFLLCHKAWLLMIKKDFRSSQHEWRCDSSNKKDQ
ncbi:11230_t:CDS:2 [Gigaspora rosea]|nr:11230_t:CDS:2 [Gigaspora rosea]